MAHLPPRPSTAPRFACSGASEHAGKEEGEDDEQEQQAPSLAARILEQAVQQVSARPSKHARLRRDWFIDLKRDIIDATHLPLTHADLARGSDRSPGKKPRTGGVWPTTMEAISRSVAAYNRAASATEHDACDEIAASIVAYAHTLRLRTHRPDEFINLLHQWIENRSVNVALKRTLDGAFTEGSRR